MADFWSVAKVGIGATLGLVAVVSLPRPFVWRFTLADPHPYPGIRVVMSAAAGSQLYPEPLWDEMADVWRALYPTDALAPRCRPFTGSSSARPASLPSSSPATARHFCGGSRSVGPYARPTGPRGRCEQRTGPGNAARGEPASPAVPDLRGARPGPVGRHAEPGAGESSGLPAAHPLGRAEHLSSARRGCTE